MKGSIKKGFGFGLTSGVITTLGLITGLNASTGSLNAIIGGIVIIAFADGLSDSLGVHISEESDKKKTKKQVWVATFSTLITKIVIALSFLIPFFLFSIKNAIMVSIVWGLMLISIFSYYISEKERKLGTIIEHVLIAILVIIITNYLGHFIANLLQ